MTLVDHQGRVLGRWNVADVFVTLFLLLLIPLLYGGYLLFRPAPATVIAVEPARVQAGKQVDVTVSGTNLRPYMRLSFNEHQGVTFLFADASKAVVRTKEMPPGIYDVILYDQAQERSRLPRAFEVVAAPQAETQLDLVGMFTAITEPQVKQLKQGTAFEGVGTVTQLGTPLPSATRTSVASGLLLDVPSRNAVNLPAVIRADCTLTQRAGVVNCMAQETALLEDVVLRTLGGAGDLLFQIDQIRTTQPMEPVTVRVRMSGDRAALDRLRVGDRDIRRHNEFTAAGTIVSLDSARSAAPSIGISVPTSPVAEPYVVVDLGVREVVMRVPAQRLADGWYYAGRKLTTGGVLAFHGSDYELRGIILAAAPLAPRE
jgi:hypothetical protein